MSLFFCKHYLDVLYKLNEAHLCTYKNAERKCIVQIYDMNLRFIIKKNLVFPCSLHPLYFKDHLYQPLVWRTPTTSLDDVLDRLLSLQADSDGDFKSCVYDLALRLSVHASSRRKYSSSWAICWRHFVLSNGGWKPPYSVGSASFGMCRCSEAKSFPCTIIYMNMANGVRIVFFIFNRFWLWFTLRRIFSFKNGRRMVRMASK